jgi:hypothetical protein
MIIPNKITDYKRNEWDIQEFFVFAVAVQGKNSEQTARKVQALSEHIREMFVENPFYEKVKPETGILHYLLGEQDEGNAGVELLKEFKFGKYHQWEKLIEYFKGLKWCTLDLLSKSEMVTIGEWLRLAPIELLERIPSVGKKTSRFFKLHTDSNAWCVPLDTHILKFLKDKHCHDPERIPKQTPSSKYEYQSLETFALKYMNNYITQSRTCNTLAEADLEIWTKYAYPR